MWSSSDSKEQVWAGDSVAVILLNLDNTKTSTITTDFKTVGLQSQQASARELWLHKDAGVMSGKVSGSVPPHGVVMYKLTPK